MQRRERDQSAKRLEEFRIDYRRSTMIGTAVYHAMAHRARQWKVQVSKLFEGKGHRGTVIGEIAFNPRHLFTVSIA